jgi:hypothetical protein
LTRHGIVAKVPGYIGGKVGEFQKFQLINGSNIVYPTTCEICGQPLSTKICDPSLKKETNKEKEKIKEKEKEKNRETEGTFSEEIIDDNDRPDATAA